MENTETTTEKLSFDEFWALKIPQISYREYIDSGYDLDACRKMGAERLAKAQNRPVGRCQVCGTEIKRGDDYQVRHGAYWCARHAKSDTEPTEARPSASPLAGHDVGCAVADGIACDCGAEAPMAIETDEPSGAAATVTMTETDRPSRSKGRGWARIDDEDNSFATETGRKIDLAAGETITVVVGVELRRRTRTEKLRERYELVVTGNDEDSVDLSLGSPQSYDVRVSGVVRADA